jgi:hypothetical protein
LNTYTGVIDLGRGKMPKLAKRAYWIWAQQRERSGALYTSRDFIGWYLSEYKRLKCKGRYDVARKDHSKSYSFDNIVLQPVRENVLERNERCGRPERSRKVRMHLFRGIFTFDSIKSAEEETGINRKTIYNHCTGRTKNPWKYGPQRHLPVRFEWA